MDLVLLTKSIIEMLVTDVDAVSVKEFETTEEDVVKLEIVVPQDDLGKVIGRNGKTIHAIRTIVQASSAVNNGKKVKIDVDSY